MRLLTNAARCVAGTITDENGDFIIHGVPAGTVYIGTESDSSGQNYVNGWWDGSNFTTDCNSAVPVVVTAGNDSGGINMSLETYGSQRISWYEIAVYDQNLSATFHIYPGFRPLLQRATISGPGDFYYEFDINNDTLEWLSECRYLVAWEQKSWNRV